MPTKSLKLYSCALCHRRKVKCDKKDPCTYCVKNRVPCVPAASTVSKPRKRRFPEAELLARLRRYEAALKDYGADIDSINNGEHLPSSTRSSEHTSSNRGKSPRGEIAYYPPVKDEPPDHPFPNAQEEFEQAQDLLQGSSDDEMDEDPITASYDAMFENDGSSLLFGMTGLTQSIDLLALHPQPTQIFTLWQIFSDNVNPLLKIFHAPTIQKQVLKVCAKLDSVSSATHALLFSIYAFAVYSLDADDCQSSFNESKQSLFSKYQTGAQCALHLAGFLRTADMAVLQALVLYLTSIRQLVDPRSLFCLTAVAERIAKRNGLHRDFRNRGLSLFNLEMRKRLWWNIVMLEGRVAEQSGSGTSILGTDWNLGLPLNISDSDLNSAMLVSPAEHSPATEMLFCLIRCEITEFLRQVRESSGRDVGWSEFSNPYVTLGEKLAVIDRFEQHLHNKYLRYCDTQIPLHVISSWAAQQAIGKLRLTAYTSKSRMNPLAAAPPAMDENKDGIFSLCVELIESFNECKANRQLRGFHWWVNGNIPFLAYLHVLVILRTTPSGDLADRTWAALSLQQDVYRGPRMFGEDEHARSSMTLAFANLAVKAWEAREAASRSTVPLEPPEMVLKMKRNLEVRINTTGHPNAFSSHAFPIPNLPLESTQYSTTATSFSTSLPHASHDTTLFTTPATLDPASYSAPSFPSSFPHQHVPFANLNDMTMWDVNNVLSMPYNTGVGPLDPTLDMGMSMNMNMGPPIMGLDFPSYSDEASPSGPESFGGQTGHGRSTTGVGYSWALSGSI